MCHSTRLPAKIIVSENLFLNWYRVLMQSQLSYTYKRGPLRAPFIPVTQLHFLVIASTAAQKNQNPDPVIAAAATAVIPAASAAAAIVAIAAAQKDQNPDPVIAAATPISIIICQSITSAVIAAACCS